MTIQESIQKFIVNNLGINLCSVRNIFINTQADGQLKEIKITFLPDTNETTEKKKLVEEWQENHPFGTKAECSRDTGISRPTIYKYWRT